MQSSIIGRAGRFQVRPLVAVAVGASFAAIQTGHAAIITSGTLDETISLTNPGPGLSLDFDPTGSAEVEFIGPSGPQSKESVQYLGIEAWQHGFMPIGKLEKGGAAYQVDAVAAGIPIDSAQPFVSATQADVYQSSPTIQGAFSKGLTSFIGFEFTAPSDSQLHYGWIELSISSDGTQGTIDSWAWDNTPNNPINAGQVPEPATGALLAMCIGGVVLRRRR